MLILRTFNQDITLKRYRWSKETGQKFSWAFAPYPSYGSRIDKIDHRCLFMLNLKLC